MDRAMLFTTVTLIAVLHAGGARGQPGAVSELLCVRAESRTLKYRCPTPATELYDVLVWVPDACSLQRTQRGLP